MVSWKEAARAVIRAYRSGDLWALADAIRVLAIKAKED